MSPNGKTPTAEASGPSSPSHHPQAVEPPSQPDAGDNGAAVAGEQAEQAELAHPPADQSWNDPSAYESLYSLAQSQEDFMTNPGDYSNVNGVPVQGDHAYALPTGDDYSNVAATLSNWADPSAVVTEDGSSSIPLVAPPVNGEQPVAQSSAQAEASNQVGEKPKKLVLACHFCRGRKLKCDGGRPICGHCAKRNITCTYDQQVRRRGPGKRTKEMRERAAREAAAAGFDLPEILQPYPGGEHAHAEPTPKKPGRKRKSDAAASEDSKRARVDEEALAAPLPDPMTHDHMLDPSLAHEQALGDQTLHDQGLGHDQSLGHEQGLEHVDHSQGLDHSQALDHSQGLDHSQALGHDQPLIDPALTGEDGSLVDLPPLEPGTLGQVIQQLNGGQ